MPSAPLLNSVSHIPAALLLVSSLAMSGSGANERRSARCTSVPMVVIGIAIIARKQRRL
ncbi:MAG: hypothetical protein JWP25_1561 [Bradyrhizobium sp.]|nr:hypothetical protein [Bradyrhizobium sp.]